MIALPPIPSTKRTSTTLVSTISSDGKIRVYDLAAVTSDASIKAPLQIDPLTEYDSKGSRLTCMTIADGDDAAPVNGKRKREVTDEDADVESADEWAVHQNPSGEESEEEDASDEGESGEEEEEGEAEDETEKEVEED